MILSVLICSMESRREKLLALVGKLKEQRRRSGADIEVRVSVDPGERNGGNSIGRKRNALLASALGEYACFVDDDDDVSPDYVALLAAACAKGRDCVGITGRILWQGKQRPFVHSIQHDKYEADGDKFTRPPNHLNPIRTEIARAFEFPCKSFGEDFDWSMQLVKAKALRSEEFVPEPVYFYTPSKGDGT